MNRAAFNPGAASVPSTSVELSLRCENLMDTDVLSKSDPFCVVSLKGSGTQSRFVEVGRTERISDNLHPVWQKKIVLDYNFEERQTLKFDIFDSDSSASSLDDHDFLGSVECSLGEIVSMQSKGFSKPLNGGKGATIHITAEELSSNKEQLTLKFSAKKLDKMDWFGKSDPFIEILRSTESNQYILVHRTEVIKNTLNPDWKSFQISNRSLSNGDDDRDLRFDVYDWNRSGTHEIIGSFHSSVRKLRSGAGKQNTYAVINKEKQKKKGAKYTDSGSASLDSFKVETVPSFLDYIKGGTQVNFTLAVDFTGSNGNPNQPSSLHYRDPTGRPNQYQTAIQSVGEIIQDYDSDKMFPALGFGARIPPDGQVSHEFFLTLDPKNPYCNGLDEVMAAYFNSLYNVQLYGPTNFSPVIRHVAKFADVYQGDPTNYFILLIITDGIITDFEETKRSIIEASHLPISIIIVGVGEEDFTAMDDLDSDDSLLRSGSLVAKRDIVQFVELRKFVQSNGQWSKELLAKEVLAEIPGQLLSYMKSKGYQPPHPAPDDNLNTFQPSGHQPSFGSLSTNPGAATGVAHPAGIINVVPQPMPGNHSLLSNTPSAPSMSTVPGSVTSATTIPSYPGNGGHLSMVN